MKTLFPGIKPGSLVRMMPSLAIIFFVALFPGACSVIDERDDRQCIKYEEREFEYVVRRCTRRQGGGTGPCEQWEREPETRTIRTCVKWQKVPAKKEKSQKQKPDK